MWMNCTTNKNYCGSFVANIDENIEKSREKAGMIFSANFDRRKTNPLIYVKYWKQVCLPSVIFGSEIFSLTPTLSLLSSSIPSGPSYGVYISQLISYARCCSHYGDFRYRHKCLVNRLLSQGYIALRLEKSFKKFYGRYLDLIEKYQRSVNVMVNDSFPR